MENQGKAYWYATLKLIAGILGVWALVSYGLYLAAPVLANFPGKGLQRSGTQKGSAWSAGLINLFAGGLPCGLWSECRCILPRGC